MTTSRRKLLWYAVIFLALFGLVASLARTFGVIHSHVFAEGPAPDLSVLDQGNMILLAPLLDVEPGSSLYLDVEEQNRRFLRKFNQYPAITLLHVVPAALFMILAPLQFMARIRRRALWWHRLAGRVILIISIPIGVSGMVFGLVMPFAGFVEASAIALFGTLFLTSIVLGFRAIRRGDIDRHREWMIRMVAVALGVSMVRLSGLGLMLMLHEGPEVWFGLSVWIGFSITSAAAEVWIRSTRERRGFLGPVVAPSA